MKPVEILLFEFFDERIAAAVSGDGFLGLELHDTVYQSITKPDGIRISSCVSFPAQGASAEKEIDAEMVIVCYSKVLGKNKKDRRDALQKVFEIELAVINALDEDQTLGGRVCDILRKRTPRDYDVLDGDPYAIANIPILINPSGQSYNSEYN